MSLRRVLALAAICLGGCATAPDRTAPGKALADFKDNKFNNRQISPRFDAPLEWVPPAR